VSNANWISILFGASGTGNGGTTVSVMANTGAARTGEVTVAGQTITIKQSASSSGGIEPLLIVTASLPSAVIGAV
jgi:hypothetical protein